jgi:sterol desaturase/sphingolipid hydroxylase (fatty acid hydroxylase superfamily)
VPELDDRSKAGSRDHESAALSRASLAVLDRSWTDPAEPERIALFRSPVLDLVLTRSHPAIAIALSAAIASAGLVVSVRAAVAPSLVAFLAGVLLWTLVEYGMHRFFFHLPRTSHPLRVIAFLVHGHHHVYPNDVRRLAATPLQALGLFSLVLGLTQLFCGELWLPCFSGFAAGHAAYEWLHWFAHHGKPRTALGRALKRHHLRHHFQNPSARWGISSPLWDYVFGTLD